MDKKSDKKNSLPDEEELVIDDEIDGDEAGSEAETLAVRLKKVKQELKSCQAEKGEYLAGWQRSKADYLNLKKEEEARRQELGKYAKADVLNDLISLADSFNMAFADKETWHSVPENWRKGVEYIHSQLLIVFRDHGMEELDPLGQEFNPEQEESIGLVETDNKAEDGKILFVAKKGYRLNGKIIRPAQVKVGKLSH